jgi:S1-C subfamily serine protease
MKRLMITMLTLFSLVAIAPAQSEQEKLLAKVNEATAKALAIFEITVENELGSGTIGGQAVCISVEENGQAIFMTNGMDPRIDAGSIKEISLTPPGIDAKSVKATFMGLDSGSGMAFFRAEAGGEFKAVAFSHSSDLTKGQMVASAGLMPNEPTQAHYLGLGYVSTVLRTPGRIAYVTGGNLTTFGSPVFNADGQAIGLVGQQLMLEYQLTLGPRQSTSAVLQGKQATSFFVPVEEFVYILGRFPTDGKVRRLPWMGVANFDPVDPKLFDRPGVMIDKIIPDTPAAKAGLQSRDIIVAVDGKELEKLANPMMTAQELMRQLARMPIGKEVAITYVRKGPEGQDDKTETVNVKLEASPTRPDEAQQLLVRSLGFIGREKVMLDRYLDTSETANVTGILVTQVPEGSPAHQAGLRAGDVITTANSVPTGTVTALKSAIDRSIDQEQPKPVDLIIRRGSAERVITIAPPRRNTER